MAKKKVEAAVDAKQKEYEKKAAPPEFAPKNTAPPPKSGKPAGAKNLQLAPEINYIVVDQQ